MTYSLVLHRGHATVQTVNSDACGAECVLYKQTNNHATVKERQLLETNMQHYI